MFFIVNRTTHTIILSDISVVLGPRQGIDLDKIMSRDKSESSNCLSSSRSKGEIEVRIKDNSKNDKINISYSKNNKNIGQNNIEGMKEDIIKEISSSLNDTLSKIFSEKKDFLTKKDLENSLKSIISENYAKISSSASVKKDEEIDMDENILSEINARTVDKMVKNTETREIKYKETAKKDTIINNVDELEDMLG